MPDQRAVHQARKQAVQPREEALGLAEGQLLAVAGHGIGGITGALLTGVFAVKAWGGADGLIGGNPGQVVTQAVGVAASIAWAAIATFVILKVLGLIVPLRASVKEEGLGMDVTQHGEEAYGNGEGSILVLPAEEHHPAPSASPVSALAR